jgi:general secretion pathway protein L
MDRHTPFKADQACADFHILRRDVQNNRMELEIAVVPRDVVERAVSQLAGWGVAPVMATMLAQGALNERYNLLPQVSRPKSATYLSRRNAGLLALLLVLAAGALLLPVVMKREAVLQLMPLVERAKKAAETTDNLHKKLDALAAQHNFLLERKRTAPVLVVLFDELTRTLPDDTWVQQLDLKGKELQIMGETGSSSKLIGFMEQSKILRETNFRSPLTKGQKPNSERFHLVTEVKPLPIDMSVAPPQSIAPANSPVAPQAPKPAQENG